jgi:cytochrome c oxidase assembly protein subunit 15
VGGILFEHTHRLAASAIGFMTIVLTAVAWWTDKRRWIRWTAVAIFLACALQGVIGGQRVVRSERDLAILHGCAAQIFFCFVVTYCVATSRSWVQRRKINSVELPAAQRARTCAGAAVAIILAQLIVAAIMRHCDAGLAIPDFPTSYGHILPPFHLDGAFRQQAIHQYGLELGLNQVTLFQIWIHFAHRVGAVCVTLAVIGLASIIFRRLRGRRELILPVSILLLLTVIQITLGILTVLLRKPPNIASAHVAVGSLVLITAWIILMRAWDLARPRIFTRETAGDELEYAQAASRVQAITP